VQAIISDIMNEKVADKMRRMCSRREYCVADIRKKLLVQLDGNAAEADEIIAMLLNEKYVDDLRYASAYARDKSSISGWGAVKIRYMLASKGVSADIIASALDEIDSGKAQARLDKLMETKFRTLKDDPQCRMKMLRFALGRGYGYEEAASIVEALIKGKRDESL
jgi:regulatory protein